MERPRSSLPGWGRKKPELLWDSALPLHRHRELEADVVFWKAYFMGVFVLFSQAPSAERIRFDEGGGLYLGNLWRVLVLFWSSTLRMWQGHGSLGSSVLIWQSLLTSSQKEVCFGSVVEWHLVKKTTKGKWGGLGFHLENLSQGGRNTFNWRYFIN